MNSHDDDGYREALVGTIKSHVDAATKECHEALRFVMPHISGDRDISELRFLLKVRKKGQYDLPLLDATAIKELGAEMTYIDNLVERGVLENVGTEDESAKSYQITKEYKNLINLIPKEDN